jgi:hypothetical protein
MMDALQVLSVLCLILIPLLIIGQQWSALAVMLLLWFVIRVLMSVVIRVNYLLERSGIQSPAEKSDIALKPVKRVKGL